MTGRLDSQFSGTPSGNIEYVAVRLFSGSILPRDRVRSNQFAWVLHWTWPRARGEQVLLHQSRFCVNLLAYQHAVRNEELRYSGTRFS